MEALESCPERLGAGFIFGAIDESPQSGDHPNHLVQPGRRLGKRFTTDHAIDRLPFAR